MYIFAFLCNRGQETVSMPKYMYTVLSIKNKTQLVLESEPTLSEKVGGAGRLFLSFFLSAWAPLRGKYGVSRPVVAILQMLLLPKRTLDQLFKNKRFATSWTILGNPCRAPWSRNEVYACSAVQWNPA